MKCEKTIILSTTVLLAVSLQLIAYYRGTTEGHPYLTVLSLIFHICENL